jgi:hypothetical protein
MLFKYPSIYLKYSLNGRTKNNPIFVIDPFVAECLEKRKSRYIGAPRNIYRHVIMSDIKDATTTLPRVNYL